MKRICLNLCLAFCAATAITDPAQAYKAYVSNEKGNTITVIDTEKMEVIDTIQTGNRPRGITISQDGKTLYLCASDDDTIEVIDTATHQITGTLPSGPDPELFILAPDGKRLYVANEDDNLVTVINLEDNTVVNEIPVGVEPEGMGISPDGKTVVNTSETTNMAHFIDSETFEITHNVLVDSRPRFAEFKSDNSEVWVSSEIGGTISVIDNASREIKHKIEFEIQGVVKEAIQPVGVRITRNGKKAFVALGPSNRVAVVNAETYEVEDYILVGQRVWQLAFTPDEKYVISTNGVSNDVTFIEVAEGKAVKSVPVGQLPWGVVVSPN